MQRQRNINIVFSTLVFLCLHVSLFGQQLTNPSFEGPRGVAKSPEGWQAYGAASSPDTQPGAWRVITEPSHGYSYISMVCRGYSIFDSYQYEGIGQELQNPLLAGNTYNYSVDLAFSNTFKADTITFDAPLRVIGYNEMGVQEVLWQSEAIANEAWKKHFFEVTPSQRTPFLILEAYYTQMPKYCGNLLVDNMQYYEKPPIVYEEPLDPIPADTIDFDVQDNGMPDQIDGREVNQTKELLFRGDHLTITVWDNRTTDGDVISLFLNNKNILKEFEISKNRLDVEVDVTVDQEYYLTLFAHNLGKIPPNTVALYISDGVRKKFLTLSSNLDKCEAVKIKIEQEL
jgi:hypothetical protein